MPLTDEQKRERIARRIAQELRDGYYVNLGIGMPTLVGNFVPQGMDVIMQSENGMLGVGPYPLESEIDPDLIKNEIDRAVPCMCRAGSMSFHHVRALHGSALNTSDRPRNLLLYEVAASDAWPLMGVKDFEEFNSRLLTGDPVVAPRMTDVPVRLPLPPAKRQGSIYETQSAAKKSYFTRAA